MKFGKQLMYHTVQEWKHYYINYKYLKKVLANIMRVRAAEKQAASMLTSRSRRNTVAGGPSAGLKRFASLQSNASVPFPISQGNSPLKQSARLRRSLTDNRAIEMNVASERTPLLSSGLSKTYVGSLEPASPSSQSDNGEDLFIPPGEEEGNQLSTFSDEEEKGKEKEIGGEEISSSPVPAPLSLSAPASPDLSSYSDEDQTLTPRKRTGSRAKIFQRSRTFSGDLATELHRKQPAVGVLNRGTGERRASDSDKQVGVFREGMSSRKKFGSASVSFSEVKKSMRGAIKKGKAKAEGRISLASSTSSDDGDVAYREEGDDENEINDMYMLLKIVPFESAEVEILKKAFLVKLNVELYKVDRFYAEQVRILKNDLSVLKEDMNTLAQRVSHSFTPSLYLFHNLIYLFFCSNK